MRRIVVAAVAAIVLLALAAPAAADLSSDLAEVAAQIDDLEAAIDSAKGARTEFARKVLETSRQLEAIASEMVAAEQGLAETESAIIETQAYLSDLIEIMDARQGVILSLQADAAAEKHAAIARAVDVYMAAHADATTRFSGGDGPSAGVGVVYADRVQNVADKVIAEFELHRLQEQEEVARLRLEEDEAEARQQTLAAQLVEREAQAVEVAARVAEVQAQLAAQKALLARMEREVAHFEGEIASLAREQDLIKALIAQEQNSDGIAPGVLLRPVPGGVSSGFGWRIHPIYGDSRLHTGWDLNASCGEPIVAAAPGRVFYVGWKGGYGNTVMIDHGGGLATLYAHQSSIGVVYDQQVVTGQVIGWVGTTGTSTACHLHWEVRLTGTPIDPSPFV